MWHKNFSDTVVFAAEDNNKIVDVITDFMKPEVEGCDCQLQSFMFCPKPQFFVALQF